MTETNPSTKGNHAMNRTLLSAAIVIALLAPAAAAPLPIQQRFLNASIFVQSATVKYALPEISRGEATPQKINQAEHAVQVLNHIAPSVGAAYQQKLDKAIAKGAP